MHHAYFMLFFYNASAYFFHINQLQIKDNNSFEKPAKKQLCPICTYSILGQNWRMDGQSIRKLPFQLARINVKNMC